MSEINDGYLGWQIKILGTFGWVLNIGSSNKFTGMSPCVAKVITSIIVGYA